MAHSSADSRLALAAAPWPNRCVRPEDPKTGEPLPSETGRVSGGQSLPTGLGNTTAKGAAPPCGRQIRFVRTFFALPQLRSSYSVRKTSKTTSV